MGDTLTSNSDVVMWPHDRRRRQHVRVSCLIVVGRAYHHSRRYGSIARLARATAVAAAILKENTLDSREKQRKKDKQKRGRRLALAFDSNCVLLPTRRCTTSPAGARAA